jgi:NTE family protein
LKSLVGVGMVYKNDLIKPLTNSKVVDNVLFLDLYSYNNLEVYAHYIFSNMDKVRYPKQGINFRARVARSLWNNVAIEFQKDVSPEIKGQTNSFSKFGADLEKRFKLNPKISWVLGANVNFIFEDKLESGEESFTDFGYGAKYFLGGNIRNSTKNSYVFPGLHEDELNVSQFMKLNLAIQFNPIKNVYILPHVNVASVGFGNFDDYMKDAFSPKVDWTSFNETSVLFTAGGTVSYDSFLGPINIDVSWVNGIDRTRVFFGLGLFF